MTDETREHKRILQVLNGCIPTIDLIKLYFPNYKDIKSARMAFVRTTDQTRGMMAELLANGYEESNGAQPPKISSIFIRFWGLPDLAATQAAEDNQ